MPPITNSNARVAVRLPATGGGTTEYKRRAIRFVAGSGISYTMVDDPTNEEVELTITSTGGGGGGGGSTWYDGTGAPSAGLGVDGDYYLDDATGDVYTKAGGTWSVTANIKGPTGQTGATGATGPTGPSGIASLPTPYRTDGTYVIGHDPLGNVVWVPRWSIGYTLVLSGSMARTPFGNFPNVEGAPVGDIDNVGAGGNGTTQTGGYYVQTNTTTNNVACYAAKTARASITSTPYLDCILRINNAGNISAWWGLQSSGAWTTALTDGVIADCLLFRYSTPAGDSTLKIITADGTAQTVTDTTVSSASFTTPTDLYVSVAVNAAGTELSYDVWNYPKTTLLKSGTITGTLPRSSVLLRAGFQCVTRTNAVRWAAGFLRVGYLP